MFQGDKVKLQFPFLGTTLCLAQPSFTTHSNIALSKTSAPRQQKCSRTRQQEAGLLHLGKAHILAAEQDGWKDPACPATGLSWMCSMPSLFISSLPGRTTSSSFKHCWALLSFPPGQSQSMGEQKRAGESCVKARNSV